MAKKAAPKKGKPKAPKAVKAKGKNKTIKLVNGSGRKTAARKPPAPRNAPLPGMEHVRYRELDAFCEGIADAREKKNEAIGDEKGYISGALAAMQKRGCIVYKHDGIELLFVPGDAKLRVRQTKDSEGEGADVPKSDNAPEPDAEAGDVLDDEGDNAEGLD